jgi:hypothetical protein
MSAINATMITAAMATMATVDVARITRAYYPRYAFKNLHRAT